MTMGALQQPPHGLSGVIVGRAETTFAEFVEGVEAGGWSMDGIQPEPAEATLGELLSCRQPRPVHWGCGLLPSRVCSLTARPVEGPAYISITAPKKASGPDLAYLFLGAEGRYGAVVSAAFALVRPAPEYLRAAGAFEGVEGALQAVCGVARLDPLATRRVALGDGTVEAWVPVRAASIDTMAGNLEGLGLDVEVAGSVPLSARYREGALARPGLVVSCPYSALAALQTIAERVRGRRLLDLSVTHTDQHGLSVRVTASAKGGALLQTLREALVDAGGFDDVFVPGATVSPTEGEL